MRHFQDFMEKFWSKFWTSLYILYIFTSPSAQDREVSQLRETFSPKLPSRMTPDLIATVQIQISWLLQMPTDLDLHYLQMQDIAGFSRTRVKSKPYMIRKKKKNLS